MTSLITSLEAPSPNIVTMELELRHVNFEGTRSVHNIYRSLKLTDEIDNEDQGVLYIFTIFLAYNFYIISTSIDAQTLSKFKCTILENN